MSLQAWTYDPDKAPENLGTLEYKELRGTESATFNTGGSQATRIFVVKWDQRAFFINDCLGWSYLDADNKIRRVLPDLHPNLDWFWASDAQWEGVGPVGKDSSGRAAGYTLAKITVTYKPLDYNLIDDAYVSSPGYPQNGSTPELNRYVSRTYTFNEDYLTVNGSMTFVSPPNGVVPSPPGKVVGTMGVQYTWHEVPALSSNQFLPPNLTAINNCLGKVNSVTFDDGCGKYPPQTILFTGVEPRMIIPKLTADTGNWLYWEITFSFLYRNNGFVTSLNEYAGHNFIYDPGTPATNTNAGSPARWDLITTDGTAAGGRIYETADLNTLFSITG